MWKVPAAVAASVSAVVIAAGFAPVAFAAPAVHPVQAPRQDPTAAPDPHASMPGMDPNMPGMTHDEMPGMDPDMPGMTHDEAPGMDPDMPGMDHGTSTNDANASQSSSQHSHAGSAGSESARPQAAVVGSFVVLNGGVLLTAGLMRRRAKTSASKPSRASRPAK
jgi:uncharacterized protein involved in copper resistance